MTLLVLTFLYLSGCKYTISFDLHWQHLSKMLLTFLTDEQILVVLQDLEENESGDNELKSDIENFQNRESCTSRN